MNLWLEKRDQPRVIAHRGASAHAPENTLDAIALAIEQHADGIELDVKLSSDRAVVVMHDATVDRTTNGSGAVHQLSLAQLSLLDAGAGQQIPTLDEVFELIKPAPGFLINIEITNYDTPSDGLEREVVAVVKRHGIPERVLYSSFNHLLIRRVAQLDPDVPRALLTHPKMPLPLRDYWLAPLIRHQFRHPHYTTVTPKSVETLRATGIGTNVWTVNDREVIKRCIDAGVSGLIGDSPVTMREVLATGAAV
jgi:glycerophosphoryl diester phosphodiesterase